MDVPIKRKTEHWIGWVKEMADKYIQVEVQWVEEDSHPLGPNDWTWFWKQGKWTTTKPSMGSLLILRKNYENMIHSKI